MNSVKGSRQNATISIGRLPLSCILPFYKEHINIPHIFS